MISYEANDSYIRPQSRARNAMLTAALRVPVVCLALLIYAALAMDLIANAQGLAAYSSLLLGYLYVNLSVRKQKPFGQMHFAWEQQIAQASNR